MKGPGCLFDYGINKIWIVVRCQFCVDGVISCPVRRPINDDQDVSNMLSHAFSRISGSNMIRSTKHRDANINGLSRRPCVIRAICQCSPFHDATAGGIAMRAKQKTLHVNPRLGCCWFAVDVGLFAFGKRVGAK